MAAPFMRSSPITELMPESPFSSASSAGDLSGEARLRQVLQGGSRIERNPAVLTGLVSFECAQREVSGTPVERIRAERIGHDDEATAAVRRRCRYTPVAEFHLLTLKRQVSAVCGSGKRQQLHRPQMPAID